MRRPLAILAVTVTVTAVTVGGTVTAGPAHAAPAAAPGTYVAVTPQRAPEVTLSGDGVAATDLPLPPDTPVGSSASITVTALGPTHYGSLVAWGAADCETSNPPGTTTVQFATNQSIADAAIVSGSHLCLRDHQPAGATVRVVADVSGYYAGGAAGSRSGVYHPLAAPTRIERTATLGNDQTVYPDVGGHDDVPTTGVGAVALSIGAATPTAAGSLKAWARGGTFPSSATTYFDRGHSSTSFAVVPTTDDGRIDIRPATRGHVSVVVDVLGWFSAGAAPLDAGALQHVAPQRLSTPTSIGGGATRTISVRGRAGVPFASGTPVLLDLAAGHPTRSGGIQAWPSGATRPTAAALQYAAGQATVQDYAIVPTGTNGQISFHNYGASAVGFSVVVVGYAAPTTIAPPATQTARYLDNLTADPTASQSALAGEGQSDAGAGNTFVLLDVGAQSQHAPLTRNYPGVAVALSDPTVRLTYYQLVTDLKRYITAFGQNLPGGAAATVAVGTNNSGNFDDSTDPSNPAYPGSRRGKDWFAQVIEPLRAAAPSNVTVIGADDIENGDPDTDGFDNHYANAKAWEDGYFTGNAAVPLVYNGSANGCPATFGASGSCNDGWTLAQFVALTHRGSLISVLPQVYVPQQAVQWANIDHASGNALSFKGSLTEHARDADQFEPAEGWAALYRADSTDHTRPTVPCSADITTSGSHATTNSSRRTLAEVAG